MASGEEEIYAQICESKKRFCSKYDMPYMVPDRAQALGVYHKINDDIQEGLKKDSKVGVSDRQACAREAAGLSAFLMDANSFLDEGAFEYDGFWSKVLDDVTTLQFSGSSARALIRVKWNE